MKTVDVLKAGINMSESRGKTHGDAFNQMTTAAMFWQAYLWGKFSVEVKLTGSDVSMMQGLFKDSRTVDGKPYDDHYIDGAAYRAIACELKEIESD